MRLVWWLETFPFSCAGFIEGVVNREDEAPITKSTDKYVLEVGERVASSAR